MINSQSLSRARTSLKRQSYVVAGVCAVADVLSFLVQDLPVNGAWIVALVSIVVADAALAGRTSWSGAVAVVAVVVNAGVAVLLGGPRTLRLNETGVLVASYRAGAWLRGWQARASLLAVIGGLVLAHLARGYVLDWHVLVSAAKVGLVSWLVGRYTTSRRAYLDEMRRQAEQEEREAKDAVDAAIAEDRAAIARDLHDVITHHVSAISVHAGAARLRLTRTAGDESALKSVRSVEDSSRTALHDLRQMLDLLLGQRPKADRDPGLADVTTMVERLRETGLEVRLDVSGTPRALPPDLDAAVFRIVQEMLTNALRHGDGGPVEVAVRHSGDRLHVETVNPSSAGEGREGRGLAGIRARAEEFGGVLDRGLLPDGQNWRTAVTFRFGGPA
ncbi:sensor histidine kinase [Lentzea albida]|uniref:histidine kinase n=1 Tax=Lentzea albida TaxID=65499 RepID=A0A1H9MIA5_9PSEU|nr:histidine kinase [Lentzea albida]SER23434.1 Signal transduction histidine kinase [Lentzea albida]